MHASALRVSLPSTIDFAIFSSLLLAVKARSGTAYGSLQLDEGCLRRCRSYARRLATESAFDFRGCDSIHPELSRKPSRGASVVFWASSALTAFLLEYLRRAAVQSSTMSFRPTITDRLSAEQASEMDTFFNEESHSYASHITKLLSMESPGPLLRGYILIIS